MDKNELLKKEILRISAVNVKKCMKCGKCTASCPAFDEMEYHPHQFVSMIDNGDIEPLLKSDAIYHCLSCFTCMERCPRGVEPSKLIEAVRLTVIRRQGNNRMTADDVHCVLDENTPGQLLVSAFRKYTK